MKTICSFVFHLALVSGLSGQVMRVPQELLGERLVAVVPVVGKGTPEDPFRPKYVTLPPSTAELIKLRKEGRLPVVVAKSDAEIIAEEKLRIGAWTMVMADDGKRAIVEFVARDRAAFAEILKDASVRAVEKRKLGDEAELVELRKVKKDFDPKQLRTPGY
jgi:hypothetical protein